MNRLVAQRRPSLSGRRVQSGLSLIELMVSLLLGLLVTGAAISMFVSNSHSLGAVALSPSIEEILHPFQLIVFGL